MTRRTITFRHRGLTLMEALLASVILAMAVFAIMMPFTAGAQAAAEDARATLAVNLAQDLMEEIIAKPFADPDGSEKGESSRKSWDDIADYDGYAEAEGNIHSMAGNLITDPAAVGLSRDVTVTKITQDGSLGDLSAFLEVKVTVSYHGQPLSTLTRLVYGNL